MEPKLNMSFCPFQPGGAGPGIREKSAAYFSVREIDLSLPFALSS
jgi:hypothetical protein